MTELIKWSINNEGKGVVGVWVIQSIQLERRSEWTLPLIFMCSDQCLLVRDQIHYDQITQNMCGKTHE